VAFCKWILAAALAATAVPASAAPVSAPTDASGRLLVLVPLELTRIDDLDFGTVIPSAVSGTVMINANTGARTFTGGATGIASEAGKRAYFGGAGSPGRQVIVVVDSPTELTSLSNPADKVPVLTLTLGGSPVRTIDPVTKTYFFGVGGIIAINPNQPEGDYQATFDVTAIYL